MHKKIILIVILFIIIIALLIVGLNNRSAFLEYFNNVINNETLPNFEYNYYAQTANGKYVTLVTFRDSNGIDKIKYTDDNQKEITIDCNDKTEVAMDFETDNFVHHYFTTISKTGIQTINDLYLQISINNVSYTGNVQTYTASISGTYKIEAWGASGGYGYGNVNPYGLGAYVSGEVHLEKGQVLYLYIGQKGVDQTATTTFNGGGAGFYGSVVHKGGQGGGATDVRLVNGNWNDTTGLQKRILVAGGGRRSSINLRRNKYLSRSWWNFKWCKFC